MCGVYNVVKLRNRTSGGGTLCLPCHQNHRYYAATEYCTNEGKRKAGGGRGGGKGKQRWGKGKQRCGKGRREKQQQRGGKWVIVIREGRGGMRKER